MKNKFLISLVFALTIIFGLACQTVRAGPWQPSLNSKFLCTDCCAGSRIDGVLLRHSTSVQPDAAVRISQLGFPDVTVIPNYDNGQFQFFPPACGTITVVPFINIGRPEPGYWSPESRTYVVTQDGQTFCGPFFFMPG